MSFWNVEKTMDEFSLIIFRSKNVVFLDGSSINHSKEPQLFTSDLKLLHVVLGSISGGSQIPNMSSI